MQKLYKTPFQVLQEKNRYHIPRLQKNQSRTIEHKFLENNRYIRLNKKKKYVLQQAKITQIQRENRILFEKISKIFVNKGAYNHDYRIRMHSQQKQKKIKSRVMTENSIQTKKLRALNTEKSIEVKQKKKFYSNNNLLDHQDELLVKNELFRKKKLSAKQILNFPIEQEICLFKGRKIIDNKKYQIQITLFSNKFEFKAQQLGYKEIKVLEMSREDYNILEKQYLNNDINELFKYIKIQQKIGLQHLDCIILVQQNNLNPIMLDILKQFNK